MACKLCSSSLCDGSSGLVVYTGNKLRVIKDGLNRLLPYEPAYILIGTAVAVHGIHLICQRIPKDGAYAGLRRAFFRHIKKIPYVRHKIEEEVRKTKISIGKEMGHLFKGENDELSFITSIPCAGLESEKILEQVKEYLCLGAYSWTDGAVSGTVYHGGKELTELNSKVFEMATWTNPLHSDVFPGIVKMESEIVRVAATLFHGDQAVCGTVTSGGTESIMLAVKAYRDYAVKERGVLKPEILVPITAHAAFDKAADMLDIRIVHVPVNSSTCTVDVAAMRRKISGNTIMLVGSAPAFPQGCIDNIQEIANLGLRYKIPVHVDACLGGFLLAFMPKAGFDDIPLFDFKLKGVTSISADTHKYGFAPKGTSVLLFREKKYRHYQYFLQPDWPGGLYASPTLAGSRPGALIAGCWATMMYFGMDGYVETTRRIIKTTRYIIKALQKVPGIYVMGNPQVSVIALASNHFDIYRLQDALKNRKWSLNPLQFPPSIHFCLTYCQTEDGVADRFIKDVEECTATIMKDPKAPSTGSAAIYGTCQSIPDRSLISDITALFMDTLYETDFSYVGFSQPSSRKDKRTYN